LLQDSKKAPGTKAIAVVDSDSLTQNDLQNYHDQNLLTSFISLFAQQKVYQDNGGKAFDITDPRQAAAFTQATVNATNYVITKALSGFLTIGESVAQSFSKSTTSASLHIDFLSALFGGFGFSAEVFTQLDAILTNVFSTLKTLDFSSESSSSTVDHMIFVTTFEPVEGLPGFKLPHLRLFYLKIAQKSWKVSLGKSSVEHFSFDMNYIDTKWTMNTDQVDAQRTQIQALLTKMSGASLDALDQLLSPQVVDTKPKTPAAPQ